MAALHLLSALLLLSNINFGECVRVILGDPVTFPGTENCRHELARLERVDKLRALVATCEEGVWRPFDKYRDRMMKGSSVAFKRTVYTDTGTYELISESSTKIIQLHVVVATKVSASEGEELRLPCYITAGKGWTIRWEKNGTTVLKLNLSTQKTKYGAGFEGKVSLSSAGRQEGDWSLIFHRAQLEDGGDYFCFARNDGGQEEKRGDPAAVRLQINKRNPDQTTTCTPLNKATAEKMETLTTVVMTEFLVILLLASLCGYVWMKSLNVTYVATLVAVCFVWWLQLRRSNVSSGPDHSKRD